MTDREAVLRFGQDLPVTLAVLPALFEEANRMRRFTVSVMRSLADKGIGTALSDFPGTNESKTALHDVFLEDWHESARDLAGKYPASIAFRGGCLLDAPFKHRWQLAPESGERLLRDMARATAFSAGVTAAELNAQARAESVRLAGNSFNPDLYTKLQTATPLPGASVSAIEGPKLWRLAEPGDDPAYAAVVADEIADWVKSCGII
jgi:hypothetical protein